MLSEAADWVECWIGRIGIIDVESSVYVRVATRSDVEMKHVIALSVIGGCAAAGFLLSRPAGEIEPLVVPSTPQQKTDSAIRNIGFLETRDHRIELKAE